MDEIQMVRVVYLESNSFSHVTMGVFATDELAYKQIHNWKERYPESTFSISHWPVITVLEDDK